ncbi:MAG: sigma-70 family RNA polymerase sigma factor [Saprospiraceae bacterium]
MDDHILVKGCTENNRKSQELIYKKYFYKMYVMCRRYTTDDDKIGQIINDAFLSVFKNIEKFEFRGSFEGWIRRITFNSLSDHFRKEKRNIKFLLIDEYYHASPSSSHVDDKYDYDELIAKINTLEGSFKEVFVKYAIEGYNHKEIGASLQISEGTSKWYLSEARKKLQSLFKMTNQSVGYGRL